jgi:hypothetical protein
MSSPRLTQISIKKQIIVLNPSQINSQGSKIIIRQRPKKLAKDGELLPLSPIKVPNKRRKKNPRVKRSHKVDHTPKFRENMDIFDLEHSSDMQRFSKFSKNSNPAELKLKQDSRHELGLDFVTENKVKR